MTGVVYPQIGSREKRIEGIQRGRVRTIAVLTLMSLVEWGVVCMSYYVDVPRWLIIVNVACVFFNVPLIWWLGGLWWEQRKREKEIERQYKNRR